MRYRTPLISSFYEVSNASDLFVLRGIERL